MTAPAQPELLGRRPALDGLRALAVSLVLAHHAVAYFAPGYLPVLAPGGFLGVDVFFVLSGFLITVLLQEEHTRAGRVFYGGFWRRRLLRLLPALLVVLMAWTVVRDLGSDQPLGELLRVDAIVLSYTTNWFVVAGADTGMGLGQMWSLAVEGQFYLVWPVLLGLAQRRRWSAGRQAGVLLLLIVLSAVDRAVLWAGSSELTDVYFRTDARADALLVGALAAVLWRSGALSAARLRPWAGPALLLVVVAAAVVEPTETVLYDGGFTVVAVLAAVAVVGVLEPAGLPWRLLCWSPAQALGRVSYGVYLWHLPVYTALQFGPVQLPFAVDVAVGLTVTGLLSAAMWRWVERPLLARRAPRSADPDQASPRGRDGAKGERSTHVP